MSILTLTVAVVLTGALALPAGAVAQSLPFQPALDLYAAAAYDEALAALDLARQSDLGVDDRVTVEQYRMLCLVALGRTAAAEDAAVSLLETQPDFALDAVAAPPRVRAMLDTTRRRVLPALARRLYAEAKGAFDRGDYTRAHDGFVRLQPLLATPALAADATLADLRTLAEGFQVLAWAAVDGGSRRVRPAGPAGSPGRGRADVRSEASEEPEAPALLVASVGWPAGWSAFAAGAPASAPMLDDAVVEAAAPATTADATPAAGAAPFAPIDIFTYDWRDKHVVAPVAVAQPITGWWGSMGEPAAGTRLGAIDMVVDEAGHVAEATIYHSVNRVYDAVLLESVKQWRFRPATRDGRNVRYRRISGVVSGR